MVHLGDITKMSGYTIPPVDVITFGSPCQDLSIAGKRAGMAGGTLRAVLRGRPHHPRNEICHIRRVPQIDSRGKAHKDADTPRYKALGNSIALPQWYYVLGGISDRLPEDATLGSLFDGIGGFPYVWAQLHAGRKQLCVWASEIEEFPIAVTKKWFPEVEDGKLH